MFWCSGVLVLSCCTPCTVPAIPTLGASLAPGVKNGIARRRAFLRSRSRRRPRASLTFRRVPRPRLSFPRTRGQPLNRSAAGRLPSTRRAPYMVPPPRPHNAMPTRVRPRLSLLVQRRKHTVTPSWYFWYLSREASPCMLLACLTRTLHAVQERAKSLELAVTQLQQSRGSP